MGFAVLLLFPLCAWFLPGWFGSRWLIPQATPLERSATALFLGMVIVAPGAYTLAFLGRTPLSPTLILGVAGVVALLFFCARTTTPTR